MCDNYGDGLFFNHMAPKGSQSPSRDVFIGLAAWRPIR